MANKEILGRLEEAASAREMLAWNRWRQANPGIVPDLTGACLMEAHLAGADLARTDLTGAFLMRADLMKADLSGADLTGAYCTETYLKETCLRKTVLSSACLKEAYLMGADLTGSNLNEADLTGAFLREANLTGANLREANLARSDLMAARLKEADLRRANLSGAYLRESNLSRANLTEANLIGAYLWGTILLEAKLENATLNECAIGGTSVSGIQLRGAKQLDLKITREGEPTVAVDTVEVAQLAHLLMQNPQMENVFDAFGKKIVLILGSFAPERTAILDGLRRQLREHAYVPLSVDFGSSSVKDFAGTVVTLAHLSRFVIADIADQSDIPAELAAFVPALAIPIQPLLAAEACGRSVLADCWKSDLVLEGYRYADQEDLIVHLADKVIAPAEARAQQLGKRR